MNYVGQGEIACYAEPPGCRCVSISLCATGLTSNYGAMLEAGSSRVLVPVRSWIVSAVSFQLLYDPGAAHSLTEMSIRKCF
jgi:hypothetical protein